MKANVRLSPPPAAPAPWLALPLRKAPSAIGTWPVVIRCRRHRGAANAPDGRRAVVRECMQGIDGFAALRRPGGGR